ncbi:uncharacterized protein LOC141679390 [Apium graveolens]|uniref:uncharacterized protein LOC141679390 n=1 Tax=Apium graveolens TaxID=4045 RepID=UPI003D7BC5BD
MVGRGSGKRLALVLDKSVANSSSEENFHLHDDDEEDSSTSKETEGHLERHEEISSIFPVVGEQHHVPRASRFHTEQYIPQIIDNRNDMYADEDLAHGDLSEGRCYRDKATLLLAVRCAHIYTDRKYITTKSNKEQLIVQCRAEGSFMHNSGYWRTNVNTEEYKYMIDQPLQDHKKLSARMISRIVKPLVIGTPEILIKTIIPLINNEHNHIVGYNKAWRGKQIAVEEVYGSWATAYQALPMFLAAIIKTNPGTIVEIDVVPHSKERGTFVCKQIFWYLKAMMDGWQHARPVISIDRTFLKGRYRGKLLIAMGVDSNNHPFPLCYGLVDEKTIPVERWTLSHDTGIRYGQTTINMLEGFNGNIRRARFLPVKAIMEYLFYKAFTIIDTHRNILDDGMQQGQ